MLSFSILLTSSSGPVPLLVSFYFSSFSWILLKGGKPAYPAAARLTRDPPLPCNAVLFILCTARYSGIGESYLGLQTCLCVQKGCWRRLYSLRSLSSSAECCCCCCSVYEKIRGELFRHKWMILSSSLLRQSCRRDWRLPPGSGRQSRTAETTLWSSRMYKGGCKRQSYRSTAQSAAHRRLYIRERVRPRVPLRIFLHSHQPEPKRAAGPGQHSPAAVAFLHKSDCLPLGSLSPTRTLKGPVMGMINGTRKMGEAGRD
jgi:hypothetical protein